MICNDFALQVDFAGLQWSAFKWTRAWLGRMEFCNEEGGITCDEFDWYWECWR